MLAHDGLSLQEDDSLPMMYPINNMRIISLGSTDGRLISLEKGKSLHGYHQDQQTGLLSAADDLQEHGLQC